MTGIPPQKKLKGQKTNLDTGPLYASLDRAAASQWERQNQPQQPLKPTLRDRLSAGLEGMAAAQPFDPNSETPGEALLGTALNVFAGGQAVQRIRLSEAEDEQAKFEQRRLNTQRVGQEMRESQSRSRYYDRPIETPEERRARELEVSGVKASQATLTEGLRGQRLTSLAQQRHINRLREIAAQGDQSRQTRTATGALSPDLRARLGTVQGANRAAQSAVQGYTSSYLTSRGPGEPPTPDQKIIQNLEAAARRRVDPNYPTDSAMVARYGAGQSTKEYADALKEIEGMSEPQAREQLTQAGFDDDEIDEILSMRVR